MKINSNRNFSFVNLFCLISLLFFSLSFGKDKKWETQLSGNQIQQGAQLNITDPEFGLNNYVTVNKKTFVELKIDDYAGPYYWYEFVVDLKITPQLNDGSYGLAYFQKVKVTNNHYNGMGMFVDLHKHLINNAIIGAKIEIENFELHNFEINSISNTVPSNVKLTLIHEVERYYEISQTAPNFDYVIDASENSINVSWDNMPEVEEYELAWTWVDGYSNNGLNNLLSANQISLTLRDFEQNCTRIQTKNNYFKIANIYDKGYVVFRIRAVGRSLQNTDKNVYSSWNFENNSPSLRISDFDYLEILTSHEHNKNWQYQSSFAENGKKKDVVSYFDGSLRNRQTVTKINSSDKAIVGEVIYDAEGRAAIEILPVPVNDNAIKYYPNLNKNLQSKVYSYQDFTGSDDENCDLQAQGMSMSSGASNYYSENNIQRNNHQDFVPRAENFPFSQIDYSLDNTGRIRKKGGVGANHQLGTNHEMKYFYSVPSQEELNRLFGYSVGNVSHYKKNIVVDPNRQVSVSYIDPQGRTIATALSSGVPENMENLDDEGNSALHQLVSTDLLNKLEADDSDSELDNNDRYLSSNYWGSNLDGLRYDAQKVFVTEGDYTFKYKMLKNTPFNYLCNQETFYYPFLYKLHLGVTDECGNVLQSLDKNFGAGLDLSIDKSQFFDTTSGDYIQVDSNYNTNYNIDYNPTMVLGNPALGAYGITKQLTVDQEALDLFADDYIKRGIEEGCILGPQNPSVDLAPCYYTCEQCTKYYEGDTYVYEGVSYEPLTYNGLTGKEAYIQMMLASNAEFLALTLEEQTDAAILNLFRSRYEAEWNAILLECQAPCRPDGYSVGTLSVSNSMMCDLNLQTLLTDMLPSGQYGFYISDIDQNGNAGSNSQSENNPATLISDNNFTIYHINGVQTPPTSVSNEIYAAAEGTQLGKNDWRHPVLFNANGWDFGTNPPTHYLNHYYNSLGEIDYVDVQWDGYVFNPLVLNVNSPSDLIVLPNSGGIVVDAEAGLYRVEPQFLANVTDFITYIDTRESWLLSLVKYHPEFHYLDYQYKTCSITNTVTNTFDADFDGTDDTITFNSDGFDAFIGSFKSYDDAKNAGLLEDATTFFQNDPFFQFPHPKDGAIIASTSTGANGEVITSTSNITPTNMLDVKRAIMYQALMANSTGFTTLSSGTPYSDLLDNAIDGYEDTNETMAQNIYRIVFCNAPGGGGCTTPMPSTFTFTDIINTLNNLNSTSFPEASDVKDRFWQYYVSYYLGLKQKIQHSFINLYAMRLGFYNDCIGNNNQQNFNKITSVLNNYSKQKAVVNSWIDLPGDDTNDDPSIIVSTLFSENGNQLAQKEKRFLPYDALYNSEQSPEDVYNDMMNTIGTNQYENSGECPMVRDTKLFLENLIRKAQQTNGLVNTVVNPSSNYTADLFINSTSSISNPYVFFISRALLEEMGGNWVNPISEMQSTIDSGNKKITFNLSQTGLPAFDSISLEIPSSGTATSIFWNNFGSANGQWIISSVPQLVGTGYDAANQEYTFDMVVRVTGNASSLGISGTTTFRDIILKGRTKVRLTCTNGADGVSASENGNPILIDPGSSDDCNKKELFADALKELIEEIGNANITNPDYNINSILTNDNYLVNFFGIDLQNSIVKWKFEPNYSFINEISEIRDAYKISVDNIDKMIFVLPQTINAIDLNSVNIGALFQYGGSNSLSRYNIVTGTITDSSDPDNLEYIQYTGYIFASNVHYIQNGKPKNAPLIFTCCNTCGDIDTDGDGIPDDGSFKNCDTCDDRIDSDGDTIPDCYDLYNCDGTVDKDCDGILDVNDNCPIHYNPNQGDDDNDGVGDVCDSCPIDKNKGVDSDGDLIDDACDNCISDFNTNQLDADNDGIGDACDICPNDFNPNGQNGYIIDANGDGIKDSCSITCLGVVEDELTEFENHLKTVFNEYLDYIYLWDVSGMIIDSNDFTPPSMPSFIADCEITERFNNSFSTLLGNDFNTDIYRYIFDSSSKRPIYLTFTSAVNSSRRIIFNNFPILSSPILSITNINIETSNFTTIELEVVTANGPVIITGILQFEKRVGTTSQRIGICEFLRGANNPETPLLKISANKAFSEIVSNEEVASCNCIPQVPSAVSCDEQFIAYTNFVSETLNNYSSLSWLNFKVYENQEEFCKYNLHHITQGYIAYITKLLQNYQNLPIGYIDSEGNPAILNAQDLFLTISAFGNTPLNYGFNYEGNVNTNNQTVINSFFNYILGTGYLNNYSLASVNQIILSYDYGQGDIQDVVVNNWSQFTTHFLSVNPKICPPTPMGIVVEEEVIMDNPCKEFLISVAETYNEAAYQAYLNQLKQNFKKAYLAEALGGVIENFEMSYNDKEYQYTLYYYDQAGNLIQTVAPKGVDRMDLSLSQNNQINLLRQQNTENNLSLPSHNFKTKYRYNSLNQLVWQSTPDGGETRFAYDLLGRIVASQNDKQKTKATLFENIPFNLQPALTIQNKAIVRTTNTSTTAATGVSANMVLQGNGYFEFSLSGNDPSVDKVYCGLSYVNGAPNTINYSFFITTGNIIVARRYCGSSLQQFSSSPNTIYNANQILKIERLNGQINYYIDGVLFQTHAEMASGSYTIGSPLLIDFALYKQNHKIDNIKVVNYKSSADFSYTRYDKLGRIFEAGQFTAKNYLSIDDNGKLRNLNNALEDVDATSVSNPYPYNVSIEQQEVTKTLYDDYHAFQTDVQTGQILLNPTYNTQNRVTTILTYPDHVSNTPFEDYETAIFYNYDIHGNVSEMVQVASSQILDYQNGPTYKRVNYEYDLISGNVNKVIYQKKEKDQFTHKYNYDADNRIINVETSRDGFIWEKDAEYIYYEHGPLARVILGDKKVQGIDYAYTLQGWLKTVNSESLTVQSNDMGVDGNHVSKDAFGYSLTYFENSQGVNGDYSPRFNNGLNTIAQNTGLTPQNNNLYNGNIKSMITTLRNTDQQVLPTQVNLYKYDQLNRIFSMSSFTVENNLGVDFNSQSSYASNYSYDKNGNLRTLYRKAPTENGGYADMDNFTYNYNSNNNQLLNIEDSVDSNEFNVDIDSQNTTNYEYDEIGQLIKDEQSNIQNIGWRVDGKVKNISIEDGIVSKNILFFYDGLGNRIAKKISTFSKGGGNTSTTYYTRDAQGNTMGVYKYSIGTKNSTEFNIEEHHIYGSSRLGIQNYNIGNFHFEPTNFLRLVGDKNYELSNHLGNVLSVVTDRKIVSKDIKLYYFNDFEKDIKPWDKYNSSSIEMTEDRQFVITSNDSINGGGAMADFELGSTNCIVNFSINRDEIPVSIPVVFRVENSNGDTIYTQNILTSGYVQATLSLSEVGYYRFILSSMTENLQFYIDDLYIYYLPETNSNNFVSLFEPEVVSYNDYYPFGMLVPNRHGSSNSYRYGFNGKEKDDELKGIGNSYDFGARMLDPRVGRWFAPDLLESGYPSYSTYNYTLNNPIYFIDPNGKGPFDWYKNKFGNYVYDKNVKSQGDVGDNGTYKGEVVMLDHKTTSTGQWINTYQLNADGTVVDSFGKQYMDNFGEFSIGNSGVKVINEHTFEEQWDEYVTNRLYKASAWLRSKEGNSWIKGSGFKAKGEIGLNKYSIGFDIGTYSSEENTVGFYSKFSLDKKEFDLSGGVNNGWGAATSKMISLLPKADIAGYMYVNTKTSLSMGTDPSTSESASAQLGTFRVNSNSKGEKSIGFGIGTKIFNAFIPDFFRPKDKLNLNQTTSSPIESLSGKTEEIKLN